MYLTNTWKKSPIYKLTLTHGLKWLTQNDGHHMTILISLLTRLKQYIFEENKLLLNIANNTY